MAWHVRGLQCPACGEHNHVPSDARTYMCRVCQQVSPVPNAPLVVWGPELDEQCDRLLYLLVSRAPELPARVRHAETKEQFRVLMRGLLTLFLQENRPQ